MEPIVLLGSTATLWPMESGLKTGQEMTVALGADIGGTTTRLALVDGRGVILARGQRSTGAEPDRLLEWIAGQGAAFMSGPAARGSPVAGWGMALPGVVDPLGGTVLRCVNVPWLEGLDLAGRGERLLGIRPALMTDAAAATWAEYLARNEPSENFAHLRLGTGVGCGVVVDGALVPTDVTRRTHWEALIAEDAPAAPACSCGLRGCLELYASGAALAKRALREGRANGLAALREDYASGKPYAVEALRSAARGAARAIRNLAKLFEIKTVSLGGGVLYGVPELAVRIREEVRSAARTGLRVEADRLGDDAGVIGAAAIASRKK